MVTLSLLIPRSSLLIADLASQRLHQPNPPVVRHLVVSKYVQVLCHVASEAREPWTEQRRHQQYRRCASLILASRGVGDALLEAARQARFHCAPRRTGVAERS